MLAQLLLQAPGLLTLLGVIDASSLTACSALVTTCSLGMVTMSGGLL